jgi:hypothetical protein
MMTAATWADVAVLESTFDRAEIARRDAAEAERAAYQRWQDCYAAYQLASDDASAVWRAWAAGIGG